MKKLLSFAAGLALVAGTSTVAQAQCITNGCTVGHSVTATVPSILNLTLSTATTALTNPAEADFDVAAGVDNTGPVVTLKSNKSASVTISTAATNWTYVGTGTVSKSAGDLRWRTATTGGAAPGTSISSTPAVLLAAGKGNRSATVTWNTRWFVATDEPGDYSLATVFTLVAP